MSFSCIIKDNPIAAVKMSTEDENSLEEMSASDSCESVSINGNVVKKETIEEDVESVCSNATSNLSEEDGVITKAMWREEQRLHEENKQIASHMGAKPKVSAEEQKARLENRYKQLQKLLQRSKFYSQYLTEKITDSRPRISASETNLSNKSKRRKAEPLAASDLNRPRVLRSCSGLNKESVKTKDCVVVLKDCRAQLTKENVDRGKKRTKSPSEEEIASQADVKTVIDQPAYFTGGTMRPYQLEGLKWLRVMYENGLNGILGDEMGLGKTVQCIALLAYFVEMSIHGPFLVCAPLSTLSNWISEFQKFTPKIPVILYHGVKAERKNLLKGLSKPNKIDADHSVFPVIVTSYEIILQDIQLLTKYKWKYLIVDEGHRIKNMNCLLIQNLKLLSTANRLLLTGTPLQNSLAELWSLLNFLIPELFHNLEIFESWFDVTSMMEEGSEKLIIEQEREKCIIATLREILAPFLLRRLKTDVELFLPPKREFLVYASLTAKQNEFYKAALNKTLANLVQPEKEEKPIVKINSERELRSARPKLPSTTTGPKQCETEVHYSTKSRLMDLRKAVNHPYLIEYPLDLSTQEFLVDENLVRASGKLVVLDVMLKRLIPNHKVLIFTQMVRMVEVLQDFCYLRKYPYRCLHGSMSLAERMEAIADFENDPTICIFLLSTRAGGLGLNLVAADTVFIYDSDWNPQCDLQAMDRCHRIGQTRPVVIYRLVVANSIDEHMVKRAAAKRKLEKMIIHKDGRQSAKTVNGFSEAELQALLTSSEHDNVVYTNKQEVFSKEELNILLDRNFGHKNERNNPINTARVQVLDGTEL